jgi:ABC-type nitrate/sulfonate/bicarbonate transport system substrate-binding protein
VKQVSLGFKAYDLHELACHFVAVSAGLYAECGIDVQLEDTRQIPDAGLPDGRFSVACGAAVMRWLSGDELKVLFVTTEKPMFWLFSHSRISGVEGLRGKRIATYPDSAPPAQFLRIILTEAGLTPDHDVKFEAAPDDASRVEMMQSGHVAAALVSSATLPQRVSERGFRELLCLGDRFRLPTTGLAVTLRTFDEDPETVAVMRDCFRASLRLIHTDAEALRQALHDGHLVRSRNLELAVELARRHFTPDGLVSEKHVVPAVHRLADALNVTVPADPASLYDQVYRARV